MSKHIFSMCNIQRAMNSQARQRAALVKEMLMAGAVSIAGDGPFTSDFTLRAYFGNVLVSSWKSETITVNRAALEQLLALAERPHD